MSAHFPIPAAALKQHILLLGKTRSGKSSKMRLIIEHFLDQSLPVCIIDPKGDWWGLKSSADGKSAGYSVIIFGSEWAKFADVRINKHSGAEIGRLVATGNRPCLIDMKGMTVDDRTQFFVDFADAYFRHAEGHRVLAIDEVHNFAPQGKVIDPQAGMALHWSNRFASEGAGMGITLLSASQRPQKVHKDYATSHETLIACRAVHKLDRDASGDWIDACGDREKKKELLDSLAGMNREEAWVYSPEIGFGPKRIKFPLFRTYNSFKPQAAAAPRLKGWAEVNLEEVKSKLAAVVEQAKASDPKELRAEIARLKKQMTGLAAAAAGGKTITDPSAIAAAEERGAARARREAESAIANARRETADAFMVHVDGYDALIERAADLLRQLKEYRSGFAARVKSAGGKRIPGGGSGTAREAPSTLEGRDAGKPVVRAAASVVGVQPAPRIVPSDGDLPSPLQKILDAITWWRALGVESPTAPQVAFRAVYGPSGGTFKRYVSELRSRGLIEKHSFMLTADGDAVAALPDAIPTTDELHASILAQIGEPLAKILRPLLEAYPDPISLDGLGAASGYGTGGGTFKRYMSSLRSLELIGHGRGDITAQEWLFP